ncbi:MAG: hypothetical protein QOF48_624 [Verrucomicrobiota bacterium]|jgi:hypothetical protein
MKLFFAPSIAVLAVVLISGCAPRYQLTLTNRQVVTTHGKPKVDKDRGLVSFTDAEGKKQVIPLFTVRTIEPR